MEASTSGDRRTGYLAVVVIFVLGFVHLVHAHGWENLATLGSKGLRDTCWLEWAWFVASTAVGLAILVRAAYFNPEDQ